MSVRVALAVVGTAVGSFFGQPAAGWAVGSLLGQVLDPVKGKNQKGPRLDDLSVQSSAYGEPLPIVYGSMRVAGNMIWSSEKKEHEKEESTAAKGGGGGSYSTYTYTQDLLLAFCEGPGKKLRRLWANGKLVYDASDIADMESLAISSDRAEAMRFYPGDPDQLPDPMIESYLGEGNVPAYRHTCLLAIEDFELEDFGNATPNFTAEIVEGPTSCVGPEIEARPQGIAPNRTSDVYLIDASNGVVDYLARLIESGSAGLGDPYNQQWYKVRYSLDGEPLESAQQLYRFDGLGMDADHDPFSLEIHAPVRFLPSVVAGDVFQSGGGDYDLVAWIVGGSGTQYVRRPNGEMLNGPDWDGPDIMLGCSQYYNGNLYALAQSFNDHNTNQQYAWVFSAPDGVPSATAWEEYDPDLSSGLLFDIVVNSAGIFIYRWGGTGLHAFDAIIKLDDEFDVEQVWTLPMRDNDDAVRIDEPRMAIKFPRVIVGGYVTFGGDRHARYRIMDLNADGSVTTICEDTLEATYVGEAIQIGSPDAPVGLLVDTHMVVFGLNQAEPVTLASIVTDLCVRTGLAESDIDVSDLESTLVPGYAVTRPMSAREALEPLQQAYQFDIVASDWILKFVKRGADPVLTLDEGDLAAHEYGQETPEPLEHTRTQELELPRRVNVQYISQVRDYQSGEQYSGRVSTTAISEESLSLAIVLDDSTARQIADVLLADAWISRDRYSLPLGLKHLALDPGDVIRIPNGNSMHTVRITATDYQFPLLYRLQGISAWAPEVYEDGVDAEEIPDGALEMPYVSDSEGNSIPVPQSSTDKPAGPTNLLLIDSPILREADNYAGNYYAAHGYTDGWRGMRLYKSLDSGVSYAEIDSLFVAGTIGRTSDALDSAPSGGYTVDESSTVNVDLQHGELASTSEDNFRNLVQVALIGVHGRWEVVAFRTATLEPDGTYTLSGFLRGLRGTDHNTANHAANDWFVLLTETGVDRFTSALADLNVAKLYKGVSVGQTLQQTESQTFTSALEALRPLSPVNPRGIRNSSNDLVIYWRRRSRVRIGWAISALAPIGEDSESYSIDIYNALGTVVLRTLSSSAETVTYTAAQQTTDFGSPQSSINVKIYQVSASVGRGTARSATL